MDAQGDDQVMTDDSYENLSFAEVRKLAQKKQKEKEEQEKQIINRPDTIKPKHIQSESVLYKASDYLRDLLGEE